MVTWGYGWKVDMGDPAPMTDPPRMTRPTPTDDELARLTFEEIMAALEDLTRQMSSGDIGIEEATDLYERAEALHALASERLARVQDRIEKLGGSAPGTA